MEIALIDISEEEYNELLFLNEYEDRRSLGISVCTEYNSIMNLEKLLKDKDYLNENYLSLRFDVQSFLHQIDSAFKLIRKEKGQETAESFIPTFIEFLVNRFAKQDDVLTTDALHSSLGYKEDNSFYESILIYLTDKDYLLESVIDTELEDKFLITFQSHLASLYRRKGDLETATKLLEACEERMERNNNGNMEHLRQLSLIEYELAYIHKLNGSGEKAYDFFGQSAAHSIEIGHEIGEWIGKCAQSRCGYLYNITTLTEYEKVNLQGLSKFRELSENNPFANRWVFNCLFNQFRISFYKGDLSELENYLDLLLNNDWVKEFGFNYGVSYYSSQARLNTLKGNYELALENYKFLPSDENELSEKFKEWSGMGTFYVYIEGIAEHYFDLANVLLNLGRRNEAEKFLKLGLLAPKYGNAPFQNWIRNKLNELK